MSLNTKPRKTTAVNKATVSPSARSSSKVSKPKGIKVITYLDDQGEIRSFRIEGHAGFAEAGQDIVCAAVSALAVSAVNGLEKYLSEPPEANSADGLLVCTLKQTVSEQEMIAARVILGTMMLGLQQINESYAERYLKFEQRRWTPCCK